MKNEKSSYKFSGQSNHKQHQKNPAQGSLDHGKGSEFEKSDSPGIDKKFICRMPVRNNTDDEGLEAEVEGIIQSLS